MKSILKLVAIIAMLWPAISTAQNTTADLQVIIKETNNQSVPYASVELKKASDQTLVKGAFSNENGSANFSSIPNGNYIIKVSAMGFAVKTSEVFSLPAKKRIEITLNHDTKQLKEVSVNATRPFIQRSEGKLLINVDATASNAGSTVLEVLEKSPGVMVDRNGGISLQGKNGVLVMIDGKQTYLSGTELNALLSSMNASQVNQIELITSPSAKYDATGNAGIINIKTKKNNQEGINGNLQIGGGRGKGYRSNNSMQFNYRKGKINAFANYAFNYNTNSTEIYADRAYFDNTNQSHLEQPSHLSSYAYIQTLKTGLDIFASEKSTVGFTLQGTLINRSNQNQATALWLDKNNTPDSVIYTTGKAPLNVRNGGINFYSRHKLNNKGEIGFDLDLLKYRNKSNQYFNNSRNDDIMAYERQSRGEIPTRLNIFSAKTDYSYPLSRGKIETGIKFSNINTDNFASYELNNSGTWFPDFNKTNHFIYKETISSAYGSFDQKSDKLSYQLGIRIENTHYSADQLGNMQKPSSNFSKNYLDIFPSGYLSYKADSLNSFTLLFTRRIDRPPYQKLNPFVLIINKYTLQKGNPDITPQRTWNFELSHTLNQFLTTTLSYSLIKDYFSQIFINESNDILVYTEGNVGKMHNYGIGLTLQLKPLSWWDATIQSNFNHKVLNNSNGLSFKSNINQLHTSMNNQFKISKTLSADLSGFYTTKARNDLQELLYPNGQLSAGLSKSIFKNAGSIKLALRDIFYTQAMEGLTTFPNAQEYFKLQTDSRVAILTFTYRFGKPLKPAKRSSGGASEEMNRAGNS
ncbi:outer membrane beta-barrel protein [Pedobacter montanisoli]|uniref:TonB dependent receptor n=1 Tax=Pedobacter montanisoli TaxID=2923277 RepID=A0ABS9ZUX8_9SPHI|nr:outer membrane beta-barrel protein [Pedobacter montanisoli]MCJ0741819.1 TonB dependent receptor [Pedobacter montanisoli]